MSIKEVFYISIFGVLGVLARFATNLTVNSILPDYHFLATLFVNLLGSFLIGALWILVSEKGFVSPQVFIMLAVGFLGGFTTFSSFSLDVLRLFESREYVKALVYMALSPVIGVVLAFLGAFVARRYI